MDEPSICSVTVTGDEAFWPNAVANAVPISTSARDSSAESTCPAVPGRLAAAAAGNATSPALLPRDVRWPGPTSEHTSGRSFVWLLPVQLAISNRWSRYRNMPLRNSFQIFFSMSADVHHASCFSTEERVGISGSSCRPGDPNCSGCRRHVAVAGVGIREKSRICDGVADCPVAEDEMGCHGCRPNQYYCMIPGVNQDFGCFTAQQRGDGVRDCPGGKDEALGYKLDDIRAPYDVIIQKTQNTTFLTIFNTFLLWSLCRDLWE